MQLLRFHGSLLTVVKGMSAIRRGPLPGLVARILHNTDRAPLEGMDHGAVDADARMAHDQSMHYHAPSLLDKQPNRYKRAALVRAVGGLRSASSTLGWGAGSMAVS